MREHAAKFEKTLNCSHRHITLEELCEWLEKETGMEFKYPDQPYSREKIPLFTHTGSGYQLLHSIGRLFAVPQYIWQQSPDGSVFVGSRAHSRWADKAEHITIDSGDFINQTSQAVSIPIHARIRPACVVNGKHITRVKLERDAYELEWEDLDEAGKPKQKSADKRLIENAFPELAGGYHLSKFAKIVGVADPAAGGEISDPFRPKYAVDVQLLDEHGNEDSAVPVFPAVPLPVSAMGSQGGDFAFPEAGTVVKLDFIAGRSDKPVISSFYAQGKTIPQVSPGEILRQQRPEVFERTDGAGNMQRCTDQTISERSFIREVTAETETRTVGQSERTIDGDEKRNVGGNSIAHIVGNEETVNGGDKVVGVGGELVQKVKAAAWMLSEVKNKLTAPKSYIGTEQINIFRILEAVIQIQVDLAQAVSTHTHSGGPKPDQASAFVGLKNQSNVEKNKLTPIIE